MQANTMRSSHACSHSSQPSRWGQSTWLKGYEDGMILITQRLSADLISISQANRANQITRDEAEYLIHERYQVAMMQHEVLSALHDSLKHDLALAAKHPGRVSQSDTAVVAQPPLSGQGQTQ
jgi:hypothetical protein